MEGFISCTHLPEYSFSFLFNRGKKNEKPGISAHCKKDPESAQQE